MKVGRPTVIEKKKQISRTIKFDTETQACEYLNLLRACKTKANNKKKRLDDARSFKFFHK